EILGIAGGQLREALVLNATEGAAPFQINLFWIVVQAATFLLFLVILWLTAFKRIGSVLEERRSRIEEGLRDADAARVEREQAAGERLATLAAAREEANEVLTRAQRVSDEIREREMVATRAEIERLRDQAAADINAEKERALSEVRSEVADLALLAAGRVVGETMNQDRERRLVEEFLAEMTTDGGARREGRN
ncbi:MAG: F0F1 ATP synthase subunit B, partial [Chloroflexota bacterium]|nr:F0F1 ATP synthase subunit B [Chloroflexota bacterium]